MLQVRGRGEGSLEGLEGCLRLGSPLKLGPLAGQRGEGIGQGRVAHDELPVEVGKAQERLHLLD